MSYSFEEVDRKIREALENRPARRLEVPGFHPASVLVPILNRPEGPTVLFTRRTTTVRRHKGQISFPGGRAEPGEGAIAAALREAHEEVGLVPSTVSVAGTLDDFPSISQYLVTPVVSLIADPPPVFVHQETEVVEPFEVPLEALLDASRFRTEWWEPEEPPTEIGLKLIELGSREIDAEERKFRVLFFDTGPDRVVWGLTATILEDLLSRAFKFRGVVR